MKCPTCNTENDKDAKFCKHCGYEMNRFIDTEVYEIAPNKMRTEQEEKKQKLVLCPNCGSHDVHFVTKQTGSDFDTTNACCGFLIFGPLGILCGLASDKKTETIRKCMNCNHEF